MPTEAIREWVADHPRVLNAAFVAGFYVAWLSLEFGKGGDSSSYFGP